jgi:hypothetical protein
MSGANWGGRALQTLAINGYNLSIVPGNTVVLPSGGGSGGPNPIFSTIQVKETGFISTLNSNKITTGELQADTIGSDSILVSSLNAYSELIGKNVHLSSVVFEGDFDVSGPLARMKNLSTGAIRATDLTLDGDFTMLPGVTHDFKLGQDALNPIGDMKIFATNVALYSENPADIMEFAALGDTRIAAAGSLDMYGADINLYQTSISNILNINGLGAVAVTAGLGATLTAGGAVFIQAGGIATLTAGGDIEIGAASGFGTSIENLRIVDNIIHKTTGSANLELNNIGKVVNEDSVSGAGGLELTAKEAVNISSLTGNVNVKAPSGYVEVQGTAFIGNTIGSVGMASDMNLMPSSGKVSVEHDLGARNIFTSTIIADEARFSSIKAGHVDISSVFVSSINTTRLDVSAALISSLTVPPLVIQKGENIGGNYSTLDFVNTVDLSDNGGIRIATLAFNYGSNAADDVYTFVDASFNPTYWLQGQGPKKVAFQQSALATEFYSTSFTHSEGTQINANIGRFNTIEPRGPQTFTEIVGDIQMVPGTSIIGDTLRFQDISGVRVDVDDIRCINFVGTSTSTDQLNFRQFVNPGIGDAHMYVDSIDGVAPTILTCDSNFANGANFGIVGPVGAGQFPTFVFFDPNNGFNGAGLSFRYAAGAQSVLRTGVGFENYNYSRIVRRISEGNPRLDMVSQNYPTTGQFTSTTITYDATASALRFINASLALEAPSGQQAFISMTSGTETAAITYESPSTSPYNRFYFGGAGLSASEFMSLDGNSPYAQLYDISYGNLGKWQWNGAREFNTLNTNLVVGRDYYGPTPFIGISDGAGPDTTNIATMTFNIPADKLEFNRSIDTSNNNIYTNELYASTIQAPVSLTDKGLVDTTLTINSAGWSGSLIYSVPYTFPFDVSRNPIYALTIGIMGHTNFNGNIGFFVAIRNNTTSTDISGWNFQNGQECVSMPATFGAKDAHCPTWTEYFDLAGLVAQGDSISVEVGVQSNSGSGVFEQGSFVWTLAPAKQAT